MIETRVIESKDNTTNMQETLSLILSSIQDVVFSRQAPETKLVVPPGIPTSTTTEEEEGAASPSIITTVTEQHSHGMGSRVEELDSRLGN